MSDRTEVTGDSPFEVCDNCGRVLVNVDTHTCPPDEPRSEMEQRRDERQKLADEDPRDESTTVLLFRRAGCHSYAYHDIDDDGTPICGAHKRSKATRSEPVTLAEAKSRGKAPCGSCRRFRE